MNNTHSTETIVPMYHRIEDYALWSYCCDERMAVCPDCGASVCVFCMDACETCQVSVF